MKKGIIIIFCLFLFAINANAQELQATVRIETPKLNLVEPAVFETLENDIREFLNNRQWTQEDYNQSEKIECTFFINVLEEISSTEFKAEVSVQSSRPVFNSNYKTTVFNHKDKDLEFTYNQFQPLDFDQNAFVSNLTAVLAYYSYIIIGYDYDSFVKEGGTPYFRKAEEIVNWMQGQSFEGWKPSDDNNRRNRYWLVANNLNPRFRGMREAYYSYHRNGLDMMYDNVGLGQKNLLAALNMLKQANIDNMNAMPIKIFTISKYEEVIKIFGDQSVNPGDKIKVVNIMGEVDPANMARYETIKSMGRQGSGLPGYGNNKR